MWNVFCSILYKTLIFVNWDFYLYVMYYNTFYKSLWIVLLIQCNSSYIPDLTEVASYALLKKYDEKKVSPCTLMELLHLEPINCFERVKYKLDLVRDRFLKCDSVSLKVSCTFSENALSLGKYLRKLTVWNFS